MTSQLRIYRIKPGGMDGFVALFTGHLIAARTAYGFSVTGAWVTEDGGEFCWVVAHDGDFAAADKAYYDSPERAALPESPADYIEAMELRMLRSVPL